MTKKQIVSIVVPSGVLLSAEQHATSALAAMSNLFKLDGNGVGASYFRDLGCSEFSLGLRVLALKQAGSFCQSSEPVCSTDFLNLLPMRFIITALTR